MRAILLILAVVLTTVSGCQKRERPVVLGTSPAVSWTDLTVAQASGVQDGYRLAVSEATRGVFPASLAVARLAVGSDGAGGGMGLRLAMKPEVDFLSWNSVFDDFRSVSEVFPLKAMALDGAGVKVGSLLDGADSLRAGMLLVYAEVSCSESDSEVRGVLYEVSTRRLLALVHASAHVDMPIASDEEADRKIPLEDHVSRDPRLLSIRTFEHTMRECLLALMANDESTAPVAPEGWIPDRQFEPLTWPPPADLRGRGG